MLLAWSGVSSCCSSSRWSRAPACHPSCRRWREAKPGHSRSSPSPRPLPSLRRLAPALPRAPAARRRRRERCSSGNLIVRACLAATTIRRGRCICRWRPSSRIVRPCCCTIGATAFGARACVHTFLEWMMTRLARDPREPSPVSSIHAARRRAAGGVCHEPPTTVGGAPYAVAPQGTRTVFDHPHRPVGVGCVQRLIATEETIKWDFRCWARPR